ncbi:MAG: polyprenyl synthetase family protein [Chloroflexota bacterium]|nr:polyprenyl synthetase family protein [Chloroflexota bacterium]
MSEERPGKDIMKSNHLQYHVLLRKELQAVEQAMLQDHAHIPSIIATPLDNLLSSGGKRLRAALALLTGRLYTVKLESAIAMAAATEMLHVATLIHDDLIDGAALRRGTQTMNAQWSPGTTVLGGDIVFSWATRLAIRCKSLPLIERFSETLEVICTGELNQMLCQQGRIPTQAEYYQRIFAKTASLFGIATESAPLLTRAGLQEQQRMRQFGELLGKAFQIADDLLDFTANQEELGKPVGSDLRQGVLTLPVLYFAETHPDDERLTAILTRRAGEQLINSLIRDIRQSEALPRARRAAEIRVEKALTLLAAFPPSPHRQALEEISAFAINRRY